MAIPRVQTPLGKASPYIIPGYAGESMMIPGSKSTIRILASAKETDNLISVFHMDGVTGDPVGFHYHNEAHDIFMCTKGQMKVWAGDQCRILGPGDFCSVPPVSVSIHFKTQIEQWPFSSQHHLENHPLSPNDRPLQRDHRPGHPRRLG